MRHLNASDKDLDVLKERLVCTFAQSQAPGAGARVLETLVPDLCVYVCPNRVEFFIAFAVLLGLLILLALLAYWSCRIRSMLAKRFLYLLAIVGLLILLFVALITCDPVWNELEQEILGALVALLVASWLLYYFRRVKQGPLP